MRQKFQTCYAEQVAKQLHEGKEPKDVKVDTRLSIMKPLTTRWITSAYDYLKKESGIIHSGFVEAGIVAAINEVTSEAGDATPEDDPFQDLD